MKSIFRLKKNQAQIVLGLCVASVLVLQGCSEEISSTAEGPVIPAVDVAQEQTSDSKLVNDVKGIVEKFKLTELQTDCLKFEELDELFDAKRVVDVREKHGGACNGDPATSPRLFSVAVDESTGEVWSDAKSATGNLEVLK